ncbi:transcription factor bHLH162 [Brachypodium distachyon]|uniref:BHLH domain-containing protein n=1 Tax=Brachypodium distachyon TaxID=15368 RepID=I1HB71_BRADI|nr:transcription factor bHLH162 [Brachypodium distachyon]KQK02309.1 hypothetical protein BRADI_2g00720v3 [Brachypodium distachyon]|eukprot:XP_003565225.1 transcription factor bHLH162 [Brachypodium distachyon]
MEEVKGKGVRRSKAKSIGMTMERKEIERKRRQHMKGLCLKLASLIPKQHYSSADTMTQLSSLDEAASYIKKLKDRVDELRQKKNSAQAMASSREVGGASKMRDRTMLSELEVEEEAGEALSASVPVVEVRHHDDSSMDVVLICNAKRPLKFHEVITVLEEEGAEIINANYSVGDDKIFYTIHSRAFSSRIGIEVSRVYERLRALVR